MFQPGSQEEMSGHGTHSEAKPCPQDKEAARPVLSSTKPRDPIFKKVRDHFDEFEKVYPERYQAKYGYWRPVICTILDYGFFEQTCL